jgi:hypothetical protein
VFALDEREKEGEGKKAHALDVDGGLPEHLDARARADRRGARARGQVSEEGREGLRGARERDVVRNRVAHAQDVRGGYVKLCCFRLLQNEG